MDSELGIQSGRIKLILKFPRKGSDKILQRVLNNLSCLKDELPKYWELNKFTNQDNITHKEFVLSVDEWMGMLAARIGNIFEVKIIWKKRLCISGNSSEVEKTLLFVGDVIDVKLVNHIIGYLMYVINLIHGRALLQKGKDNRIDRRLKKRYGFTPSDDTKVDAREHASNARIKVGYLIYEVLGKLLAMKKKNKKEQEIYKYILNNLKLDFTDKPGPRVIKKYDDIINWDKARTNPTIFKNKKLIN